MNWSTGSDKEWKTVDYFKEEIMNYYVIPDIHARADLLEKALDHLYNLEPDGGKIIFLGDYIDRGPENLKCLELVANPANNWDHVCLKGNHEDMFVGAYYKLNYYYDQEATNQIVFGGQLRQWVDWMQHLDMYHIVDDNIFVHAAWDSSKSPEDQTEEMMMWSRYRKGEAFYGTKFLTHGHTPCDTGPLLAPNRCDLDCGAFFSDRLVIGVYVRDKKGPQEFIEINT